MLMISRTVLYTCGHASVETVPMNRVRNWERQDGVSIAPTKCRACHRLGELEAAAKIHKARVQAQVAGILTGKRDDD